MAINVAHWDTKDNNLYSSMQGENTIHRTNENCHVH